MEFITIECYIFANYIIYDDRSYLIDYIEIHTPIDLEQYSLLKYSRFLALVYSEYRHITYLFGVYNKDSSCH